MAFRQGIADDQPSGSARCTQTRTFLFDFELHWCERRSLRRHALLGRREVNGRSGFVVSSPQRNVNEIRTVQNTNHAPATNVV